MKPREAFRKETLFGNRGLSQINFRLILDSHPTPSPDAKWDLKMENRSGRVIYVSTKMTGNHQGRFLCGNRKEQAVEIEYFPRRPRILPTTSRFPSHSSELHAHEEDELQTAEEVSDPCGPLGFLHKSFGEKCHFHLQFCGMASYRWLFFHALFSFLPSLLMRLTIK